MKQRDHRMSAGQMREYLDALAACDEYGTAWRGLVIDCVNGGFTPQEIADRTGEEVQNVLAALHLPTSLAELDPAAMNQAAREAAAKARGTVIRVLGAEDESED
jgi:glycerol dehydrogenase-like iron-containing ADH family enzyme